MQRILEQLEAFIQRKVDVQLSSIHAHIYHIQIDPLIHSFDINLHFLDEAGDELERELISPLKIVKVGYSEHFEEQQLKQNVLDLFKRLRQNDSSPFLHPTYISFEDEWTNYHVQSLD